MAFLLGQARTATVQAQAPCRCVLVHRKNFEALLREFPDLVQAMLVEMARRLRDHTERSLEAKEAEPGPGGPDRPSG
jgi:CRP-like cAMP-binding protein